MKLTKKILRELIGEVIHEERLGEASSTVSSSPRKGLAQGDPSPEQSQSQSTYDTRKADTVTKAADYKTKNTALINFAGNKYRKDHRGSYLYRSTSAKGYSINPDWTTKANASIAATTAKNTATSAESSALSD